MGRGGDAEPFQETSAETDDPFRIRKGFIQETEQLFRGAFAKTGGGEGKGGDRHGKLSEREIVRHGEEGEIFRKTEPRLNGRRHDSHRADVIVTDERGRLKLLSDPDQIFGGIQQSGEFRRRFRKSPGGEFRMKIFFPENAGKMLVAVAGVPMGRIEGDSTVAFPSFPRLVVT